LPKKKVNPFFNTIIITAWASIFCSDKTIFDNKES